MTRPRRGLRGAALAPAIALAIALASAALPPPASAHSLKVFAVAEGATIGGTVYFSGAARARNARVTVYAPDGAVLAETVTDENGRFAVPVGAKVDHRIVADSGDGHAAEFVVHAGEIASGSASAPPAAGGLEPAADGSVAADRPPSAAVETAQLESALEAVVARHVTPLRQQLEAYEDRVRWHDVLGGIGYILGLTGIAAYLLARRRS